MSEPQFTQRAYTLRLAGPNGEEGDWRDWLWRTHEAVNRGAKVFGDWLLTMRGGLCHTLVDAPVQLKGGRQREPTIDERRDRRIVLALSWLSVESQEGAPTEFLAPTSRDGVWQTVGALRKILQARGVSDERAEEWVRDCSPSLQAAIRNDAIWVNRSAAFDAAVIAVGDSLTRDEIWDLLERFFGSRKAYFPRVGDDPAGNDESAENGKPVSSAKKSKDLSKKARGWLSNRFGSGRGSDFEDIALKYQDFAAWCRIAHANPQASPAEFKTQLSTSLNADPLPRRLAGRGSNRVQLTYEQIVLKLNAGEPLPPFDMLELADAADSYAAKKRQFVGRKRTKPWATRMMEQVAASCGFRFRDELNPKDRTDEFSVILDHAARRVCMAHSWMIRAEGVRQKFATEAGLIEEIGPDARRWLDEYCRNRSDETNATDEYRIRRRALGGWKELVAAWSSADCRTEDDRIRAARDLQADPDLEKFGDIQLFEALADDAARCVWQRNGEADPKILVDYVAATDAATKQRRFKVPAYRHPDPLRHPVFCDFGKSRWGIDYAAHRAPANASRASETLKKKSTELVKAREAAAKAKTPEKAEKALAKVARLERDQEDARRDTEWLSHRHALRLTLFDGASVCTRELIWRSKRFTSDAALDQASAKASDTAETVTVPRADRLGRAAAKGRSGDAVEIAGLFAEEEWSGRLQAPRAQLDAIAAVLDNSRLSRSEKERRVTKLRSRIRWLISFSARLTPVGPWIEFTRRLPGDARFDSKKRRLQRGENRGRNGRAQLILGRIPGLRILSVDLGHRYAAACAVWLTMPLDDVAKICREAGAKPPREDELYKFVEHGKRRLVFRRVGPDRLPDNTLHPAPWARLERQFLIKLQGEESSARKASGEEIAEVDAFEKTVGFRRRTPRRGADLSIDSLMFESVRTMRLALSRHARRAKIAFQLTARSIPGIGGSVRELDAASRVQLMTKTLVDWHELAHGGGDWNDPDAAKLWQEHVAPILGAQSDLPGRPDDESFRGRKKRIAATEGALRDCAEHFAARDNTRLQAAWTVRWLSDKAQLQRQLRRLRDWIIPRGIRKIETRADGTRRATTDRRALARAKHTGGLSLTRIATMKALYQVQKAFRMQPEPDKRTKNVPGRDDNSLRNFGKTVLEAMERLRENRVKQVASKVVSAALGLGGQWQEIEVVKRDPNGKPILRDGKPETKKQRRWKWDDAPKYPQCHAIVIENLQRYRPEETRTRRENRQLMSWSAANVRKYISEACELYGLYLEEVSPAYTSRQDCRTGAPGVRCVDIAVADFVGDPASASGVSAAHYLVRGAVRNLLAEGKGLPSGASWEEQLDEAKRRADERNVSAWDRYVLAAYLDRRKRLGELKKGESVRIPQRGGEVFVSANENSPAAKGLQADLNAAANIGLKALLDPDWVGAWWYVPCDPRTYQPLTKSVAGSLVIAAGQPLCPPPAGEPSRKKRRGGSGESGAGRPINLWRDICDRPLTEGNWRVYAHYQNDVQDRVVRILRRQAGLDGTDSDSLPTEVEHPF